MPRRAKLASLSDSHSETLPRCEGPRLKAFHHHDSPIRWMERLDNDAEASSVAGKQGYVFHVQIESQDYALKVFKFFNPESERWYWEDIVGESFPVETIAYHTDPFYAECRAYGRIEEAIQQGLLTTPIAVPCRGYLLLSKKDQDLLKKRGFDLEEDCLDQHQLAGTGSPPARAIVKDLVSQDPGIKKRALTILSNIKKLNALRIYNCDIKADNFRGGQLVDFGSSWTEPHCFNVPSNRFYVQETYYADLAMFDDMIESERISTHARGLRNLEYAAKLRGRSQSSQDDT